MAETADLAALAAYALPRPIAPFPLAGAGSNNLALGLRAGGRRFVWKQYQAQSDPAAILCEHRLLTRLASAGLPFAVPAPLPARDGGTLVRGSEGWQALFHYLPGSPVDRRDPRQVEAAAVALARLHLALAELPDALRPTMAGYNALSRVHPRVPAPGGLGLAELGWPDEPAGRALLEEWRAEVAELERLCAGPYHQLPRQIVHGDFGASNLLWHAGQVGAIIDFEFACLDARAIDLAALIDMAAWAEGAEPDWEIVRAALRGYDRHIRLTDGEAAAMPWLMRLRNSVSVTWWTGRAMAAGEAVGRRRFERQRALRDWAARSGDRLIALAAGGGR